MIQKKNSEISHPFDETKLSMNCEKIFVNQLEYAIHLAEKGLQNYKAKCRWMFCENEFAYKNKALLHKSKDYYKFSQKERKLEITKKMWTLIWRGPITITKTQLENTAPIQKQFQALITFDHFFNCLHNYVLIKNIDGLKPADYISMVLLTYFTQYFVKKENRVDINALKITQLKETLTSFDFVEIKTISKNDLK